MKKQVLFFVLLLTFFYDQNFARIRRENGKSRPLQLRASFSAESSKRRVYLDIVQFLTTHNQKFSFPKIPCSLSRYVESELPEKNRGHHFQLTNTRTRTFRSADIRAGYYWMIEAIYLKHDKSKSALSYLSEHDSASQAMPSAYARQNQIGTSLPIAGKLSREGAHKRLTLLKTLLSSLYFLLPFCSLLIALIVYFYRSRRKRLAILKLKSDQIASHNKQLAAAERENQKLKRSKLRLAKEIRFRVYSNLQIVIDLLSSQSKLTDDKIAVEALMKSQERMEAMSLIHKNLSDSPDKTVVKMGEYIPELIHFLTSMRHSSGEVRFKLSIEPFSLDIATAVPVGLIINEAVTNSLMHAFSGIMNPEINVVVERISGETMRMQIKDNGVGLGEDIAVEKSESLGMNLILGLSRQIDAVPVFINSAGLSIEIVFNENKSIKFRRIRHL